MSHEAITWALEQAPIPPTEKGKGNPTTKLVVVTLAHHANSEGRNSHPSIDLLCAETELSASTVRESLAQAEACGLIKRDGKVKGGTTNWTLNLALQRETSIKDRKTANAEKRKKADAERQARRRARKAVEAAEAAAVTPGTGVTNKDVTPVTGVMSRREPADVTPVTGPEQSLNGHWNPGAAPAPDPPRPIPAQAPGSNGRTASAAPDVPTSNSPHERPPTCDGPAPAAVIPLRAGRERLNQILSSTGHTA